MYIKVDYSVKRKGPEGRPDMPGEFALYTKKHWWNKWEEMQTYASLEWAMNDARRLRNESNQVPQYF